MSWFRRTPLEGVRWVAIDCETSGLDMARDRLLSVGAVQVQEARIRMGGTYAALVRQSTPSSAANILVHGIGGELQLAGRPLEEVALELRSFAGDAIPVGFHAPFDEAILRRHGVRLPGDWVDLATLAPAFFPDLEPRQSSLDHWLNAFGIPVHGRHDALGDAFSTAQLLLVVLSEAGRQGLRTLEALQKMARQRRWLGP